MDHNKDLKCGKVTIKMKKPHLNTHVPSLSRACKPVINTPTLDNIQNDMKIAPSETGKLKKDKFEYNYKKDIFDTSNIKQQNNNKNKNRKSK